MQENININDSTINPDMTFRNLVFMNMQQLTNFPYIEKDFDALTDYELISRVVTYLNSVINNSNEQNTSINNLYNAFLQLQTYVNNTKDDLEEAFNNLDDYVRNYFANLDVQDEINNKLDQMLEDGVLEQIIEQFLQSTAIWCFDTVEDMKQATNLIDSSYAKTLGYYSVNDGGCGTYRITETESETEYQEELESGLYATLIIDNVVNIEQFGAYGDGIHDDYLAIKNCLDYCNKISFNKNYICNTLIEIEKDNMQLNGNGKITTNKPVLFQFNNSNNINISNLEISSSYDVNEYENVGEITSDPNNYTALDSILDFNNCNNINIINCKVIGGYTSIYAKLSQNVFISKCDISMARHICLCLSTSQFIVKNNRIHDIDCDYTDQYANYLFQATDNYLVDKQKYSIISNNILYNNKNWDAIMSHVYNNLIISNNHIYEVRNGIDLSLVSDSQPQNFEFNRIIITDNILEGTSTDIDNTYSHSNVGITFASTSKNVYDVLISNNIIDNFGIFNSNAYCCLELTGVHYFNIIGNIFKKLIAGSGNQDACIYIGNTCENINITGNIFDSIQRIIRIKDATINGINIAKNQNKSVNETVLISNSNISNFKFDDDVEGTPVTVGAGCVVNGKTYNEANSNLYYGHTDKYYIKTTYNSSIPANSYVVHNVTVPRARQDDLYLVQAYGTGSRTIDVKAIYGASDAISLILTNTTNEAITPNLTIYIIRFHTNS